MSKPQRQVHSWPLGCSGLWGVLCRSAPAKRANNKSTSSSQPASASCRKRDGRQVSANLGATRARSRNRPQLQQPKTPTSFPRHSLWLSSACRGLRPRGVCLLRATGIRSNPPLRLGFGHRLLCRRATKPNFGRGRVCLRHEPEAILARGESGSSRSDLCDLDQRAGACWRTPLRRPSYGRGGKAGAQQGMLPWQWAAYLGPLPNVACRSGAPRAGLPSAVRRAAAAREDSSNLKWWLSQPGSGRLAFNDCRYGVAE